MDGRVWPALVEIALEVAVIETDVAPWEVEGAQGMAAVQAEERVVVVVGGPARPEQAAHRGEGSGGALEVLEHLERDDAIEAVRLERRVDDVVLDETYGAGRCTGAPVGRERIAQAGIYYASGSPISGGVRLS